MHNSLVELEQQLASLQSFVKQLQSTDSVSTIDKGLLQQKCLILYELILNLSVGVASHTPNQSAMADLPPTPVTLPVELPVSDPQVLLLNDITREQEIEFSLVKTQDLFAEIPQTETEIQNERIEGIIQEEEVKNNAEPMATLTKEEMQELSLHEKIAQALPVKPDLSEKLSGSGIPNLKSAINVNLKIAIVNDLFKENTVEYVKAIDKLNSSENIHEAMRYFTELKHTYDWDNQNALVKELESLVNKRFASV